MLENAVRICEAHSGTLVLGEDDGFRVVALHGAPAAFSEARSRQPIIRFEPGHHINRLVQTKRVVHIPDLVMEPAAAPHLAKLAGARTLLSVPMLKDNEVIGAFGIYRQEVRPFTDKQIELVKSFAAQAVIAIENTRLLSELRQSLEQQTAMSKVLSVISSSPGDLEPVFATMLENAVRICDATFGNIYRWHEDALHLVAGHNTPPAFAEARRRSPLRPGRLTPLIDRMMTDKTAIHTADAATTRGYLDRSDEAATSAVELAGARTVLTIPMLKENELIGSFTLYRQEVRPFTDKQIELVHNFAAQAVIAIENTRLLSELRRRTTDLTESLENLRTAQDRLVQTEKLASLGQLTAGIAHEIKNPLNFVNNFSSVSVELIDELKDVLVGVKADDKSRGEMTDLMDTLRDNLGKVVQHGKRADAIVKNMLLHSRQGSGENRPVEINGLVEESLNLAYHGARAEKQGFNITLERSFDPTAGEVDLFPQEITRVLLNLISNAFYAATKRNTEANQGDYEPTLTAATKNLGNSVEIRIRDNGTGIPPEIKEKMFNPFFTTKPAGEGTGLGLSELCGILGDEADQAAW